MVTVILQHPICVPGKVPKVHGCPMGWIGVTTIRAKREPPMLQRSESLVFGTFAVLMLIFPLL